jgi:OOP family OmpA-OmpF porin
LDFNIKNRGEEMNSTQKSKLAGLGTGLLLALAASQSVQAAYWVDSEGTIVRNSAGECWVDSQGVKEHIPECGGMVEAAPVDSDGDGVFDDKDRCPGTPAGVPVDKVGCPLDSDGDGVTDDKDRCPGTMMGARVDQYGCEAAKAAPMPMAPVVLEGVNFEYDSATLTGHAMQILDGVAKTLKEQPDQKVTISGHTDSRGSDAYNQKLSERRAQAVVDYLVSQGVNAGNLSAMGHGENMPVETNDTEAGRAANRRVEMQAR